MKKNTLILLIAAAFAVIHIGCSKKESVDNLTASPDAWEYNPGLPRLIVSGSVSNTDGQALEGIYVAVYGVREHNEKPLISYNYAITDTAGQYTIIRYRGREMPMEVSLVATDSTGVYKEQTVYAPVTYDTIRTAKGEEPYNAFVTADFILTR